MKKLSSRKLWAFLIWTIQFTLYMILKPDLPEVLVVAYAFVTCLYVLGQAAIDFIKAWRGKDE